MKNKLYYFPKYWIESTIEDICTSPQYGYTTKAAEKGDIKLLRTTDITSGKINWDKVPFCSNNPDDPEKFFLYEGDIVVSRAGSVGISFLITKPQKAVFASYLIRFRPLINRKYFKLFLESPIYWRNISEKKLGIAVQNVNASKLKSIKLPIPSIPEQNQIVSKIDELFSELDNGIENLKKARVQLKTFRQAVLKYAFEGKLTEQWRTQQINVGDPPEPAEKLLERIKKEREKHYQQQAEDWKKACQEAEAKGKKKPAKPKKTKDLPPLTEKELAELPRLPKGWGWIDLGKVCYGAEYGTSSKSQAVGKVPVLRMGNIQNGKFDWSDLVYTSDSEEIEKYKLNKNDVLFNRTNSPEWVGKTAIYKTEKHAIFAGYLIRINYDRNLINGNYLNYFLNSQTAKQHGNKVKSFGVNQSNINATKLLRYPFPLATLLEQTQIVSEIETRLSVCDKLEQTIDDSLKKSEALRQSILKKAFSGELTRSWREKHLELISGEHSAQKLLERIKAEKAKAEAELKKSRSARSKKKNSK